MPIYEYRCQDCRKRTSVFLRTVSTPADARCEHCGSAAVERLISGFAYHKSMQSVWEESGEPTANPSMDYYKDPRNIGRWTEKRLKELGTEVPPQVQQMIDAAREGELPPSVKDV